MLRTVSAAVVLAILGFVALTAHSAQAQTITIVSGNNQIGSANTALGSPLVVLIDCTGLSPIPGPCGTVVWRSSATGDTFAPSVSQTIGSFPTGTASTVLTLGSTPGPRTVTATSGPSASVTFTINGGQVITGTMLAASQGTVAVATATVQTTNIGLRLAALRGGATGMSLGNLSLKFGGESVSLAPSTALFTALSGGGASADSPMLPKGLGIFATGQGSFGNQDATSQQLGFDFHTAGITLGADYRFTDRLILGTAFGYVRTKSAFDSSLGDSTINGYSLSAFTNYYIMDRLYVDGIVTIGLNTYDTERNISGASATANGSTEGSQLAVSTSTGYDFNSGGLTFGPRFSVNYVRIHIDSYSETGASPFNLRFDGQTIESVTTTLGGQVMYAISTSWGVLSPFLSVDWEHEYLGNSRTVTGTVVATPSAVVAVQTSSPTRDYCNLGVGATATLKGGLSAFFRYGEVLGRSNFTDHSFNVGARLEF